MFLLLFIASVIYFILGEPRDGAIMLIFVTGIISIEAIKEWKTDKTLEALKNLSAPQVKVLRDGLIQVINSSDLVPGDIMYIAEGVKVPADGLVIRASTLRVDESSLTGESEGVWKVTSENMAKDVEVYWRRDYCYAGTLVTQGTGTILVDNTGSNTEYGKIGMDVASAPDRPTPLEKQTDKLVKLCAAIAAILLVLVGIVTYFNLTDHDF
jgi:Ca2+-transporting ATPase